MSLDKVSPPLRSEPSARESFVGGFERAADLLAAPFEQGVVSA
jgi:hypothetical protein